MAQPSLPSQSQQATIRGNSAREAAGNSKELARVLNLETLMKEGEAAQSAFAAAQESGMGEGLLMRLREAMELKAAKVEQAKPLILRAGEAQSKVALLVGQAATLKESYEGCLAAEENQRGQWRIRIQELKAATKEVWESYHSNATP